MADSNGYLIVTCTLAPDGKEDLKHYLMNARPVFSRYGGKPLGQWAVAETIKGSVGMTHIVVIEFPDLDAVRKVFVDPAYVGLVPARDRAFSELEIMISKTFEPAALLAE